jgi:superfamily II DNA or RNA helicase
MTPGTIVRCRNRDWVLLPNDDEQVFRLRPLTGTTDSFIDIHKGLCDIISTALPGESVQSAQFPLPTPADISDANRALLLWQSARLTLRDGASPFRSLGRISIRPRTYQFVPMLMALRLDPVRMLIADDVGVGKTIEALVIARELFDRGEIKRLCVLCPPYLCDQWQKELTQKFNLETEVIRAGTVGSLERRKAGTESIYRHYPILVASIDFLKSDRNKHLFLMDCPDLVIVDEAHGSALADTNQHQHQRHELLRDIAAKQDKHLILLTATPHSGIESAFRSLLSLLNPTFASWDMAALKEPQRIELARHYVQRTRADIEHGWEGEHCFPKRDPSDETYRLSKPYRELFDQVYAFCWDIVRSGDALAKRQQRARHWGALALLRCVMSSPAAAIAALENRHATATAEGEEVPDFRSFVFESTDDLTDDDQPTPPVEAAEAALPKPEQKRLRELGRAAAALVHSKDDTKFQDCVKHVGKLLRDGFRPILWCRYVATAEYLAKGLQKSLEKAHPKLRVVSITGRLADDERRTLIEELEKEPLPVLVATDCLSEGVNLQQTFNAVLHYDLPWNPNRLEQREGRVDRFLQPSKVVKAIRYYCPDSPVDGVVLEVLLNKAREIHRTLGTHVPVPDENETVTEALVNALFLRPRPTAEAKSQQLVFDFGEADVAEFHRQWEIDAQREKLNRTRFAQRTLKPDEVQREMAVADNVLGDSDAVRDFILNAAQRINLPITKDRREGVYRIAVDPTSLAALPDAVRCELPDAKKGDWFITFLSPPPEPAKDAEYLGRNHRFVAALAGFLMEEALSAGDKATAARCGVIRTKAVKRLTIVLLLRIRYLIEQPERAPLLAEEVLAVGYAGGPKRAWLDDAEALRLLSEAQPDQNMPQAEKRELVQAVLDDWPTLQDDLRNRVTARGDDLEKSHKRIRQAVAAKVRQLSVAPQLPPDLLGILVLQPII